MFAVVVPKFTGMLGHGKVELPWLAQAVLSTGTWFNANWDLLLLASLLVVMMVVGGLRSASVRQRLLNGLSRTPLIGQWLYLSDVASWSYTLAAMLSSRVELLHALQLSETVSYSPASAGSGRGDPPRALWHESLGFPG